MTPPAVDRSIRETRAEIAYQKIRELIVEGRLAPGSRIIETDLVDRLDVSRTTVRSALQRLNRKVW
jgi:DNA-binding GntR family transcriptional regulator